LEVTEIAVADEIAAAADLVKGKLSVLPAAVVRGLHAPVDDGRGAASLRRPIAEDMFALGTRDVVRSRRTPTGFGEGGVPVPVLRSSIEAALRACELSDGLELMAGNPWRSTTDSFQGPPAVQLLRQAEAVIVPRLGTDTDSDTEHESIIRLGMAISALLIQLHAEGLSAAWLSRTELADLGPVGAPQSPPAHGLVIIGQPDAQIER